MGSVVGLDVGGTSIKGGVVDMADGVMLTRRVANPRHDGPEAVVEAVLTAVDDLVGTVARQGRHVDAVGVAALGIVAEADGIARWSSTVDWRDVPLRRLVAERTGAWTVVGHDVRAAAVAEATLGAGRGHRHVVFLPLGTSLSIAQVIDGHAVAGATWRAGEIGQLPVHGRAPGPWEDGPAGGDRSGVQAVTPGRLRDQPDTIGQPGDRRAPHDRAKSFPPLEAVASAHALAQRFAEATGQRGGPAGAPRPARSTRPADSVVAEPSGSVEPAPSAGAQAVIEAAIGGDTVAQQVLGDALGHLADALAAVITFADPSVVVVGGGPSLAGESLLGPLRTRVAATLTWREPPPLVAARFGDDAGWVGAALLAWRRAGLAQDRFPSEAWP